jgi:hypothetical protein
MTQERWKAEMERQARMVVAAARVTGSSSLGDYHAEGVKGDRNPGNTRVDDSDSDEDQGENRSDASSDVDRRGTAEAARRDDDDDDDDDDEDQVDDHS